MKKIIIGASFALALLSAPNASAQKLGSFGSSIEKKIGFIKKRVPYTSKVSYLGYAAPNTEDEVKEGKKFYYIYVWIPAVAPELGVRMISPAVKAKKAIVGANYEANKDSKDYFDTYVTLERSDVFTADKINNAASATWYTLDKNDDSSEMPAQPSGSSYNSLLRYKSEKSDPLKALTKGLYRIGFTSYKKGEVKGTFLAQIAAPVKLPGVEMAKTLEELSKKVNK